MENEERADSATVLLLVDLLPDRLHHPDSPTNAHDVDAVLQSVNNIDAVTVTA
jgi:hypothetical protein